MEWKQELTEPSLHTAQQLLRSQRHKEESGPVTAPHSATVPENQANMQLIQNFPFWDGYKHSAVHPYNRRNLKLQPIF